MTTTCESAERIHHEMGEDRIAEGESKREWEIFGRNTKFPKRIQLLYFFFFLWSDRPEEGRATAKWWNTRGFQGSVQTGRYYTLTQSSRYEIRAWEEGVYCMAGWWWLAKRCWGRRRSPPFNLLRHQLLWCNKGIFTLFVVRCIFNLKCERKVTINQILEPAPPTRRRMRRYIFIHWGDNNNGTFRWWRRNRKPQTLLNSLLTCGWGFLYWLASEGGQWAS